LLQDGIDFVAKNSRKMWKKTADGRVEMPDYPERAVFEGLVNALIHRNYLEIGSEVHIDMFDNRLEIYSPGGMIDGSKVQDRDIMQIPSRRRNPIIADIFNRLEYMELRGSGFKKIISDYRKQINYTVDMEPKFSSDNDSFLLLLNNLNYKERQAIEKQAIEKQAIEKQAIEKRDKKVSQKTEKSINIILEHLKTHGQSTTRELADQLGLSLPRTRAILAEMGEIEPVGERRWRVYRLKQDKVQR
jgi:predicted HTH transcriptional regulator